MTTETLVAVLEREGVHLIAEGESLKLRAPADKVPGSETITELRENKAAVLEYLRERRKAGEIQFSSFPAPIAGKTEKLETAARAAKKPVHSSRRIHWRDFYEWRMEITLEQLCQPDYPAGLIQWLDGFSPALHRELTSRLPDKIQRLWEARAPYSDFEVACTELVECHRSVMKLFRRHHGDNHDHDNHEDYHDA